MAKVYVLHENPDWTAPLFEALAARAIAYEDWNLLEGRVDPAAAPPEGVFYNRMSASAHTRDHRYAPELAGHVLNWLELHGRRIVNGPRALALEIDKLAQYTALRAAGIAVPATIAAVGREQVLAAAEALGETPFILKPNRGGAGAGVRLVESRDALAAMLDDPATPAPLDGTWLIQQYIAPREPAITRCEFIGGRFVYAVRVDTSDGFELCPADACEPGAGRERFEILDGFEDPLLERYRAFLEANAIEVAALEFIEDAAGNRYTYDLNTNTNYNARAERLAGVSGMDRLAAFLGGELARVTGRSAA